jgi:exopolysaccharide production protein ExoZ
MSYIGSVRAQTFTSVQALRLVAAVAVLLVHTSAYVHDRFDRHAPRIDALGGLGVWLFFAISGFVMVLVVDRRAGLTGAPSWREFAVQRVVRVAPLYWLMTTLKLGVVAVASSAVVNALADPWTIVRSYLFVPARDAAGAIHPIWGVGWTLLFEMAFYALVTAALAVRVDPLVFCSPFVLASAVASTWRPDDAAPAWFYADPVTLYFLAGMVIARRGRRHPARALAVLVGIATLMTLIDSVRNGALALTAGVTSMTLTLLLLVAVRLEHRIARHVPRAVLTGGAASYALYLTHPLVAPLVPAVAARLTPGLAWQIVAAASVGASLVVGVAAHRIVEVPLTRTLRRVLLRPTPVETAVPGTSSG